MDLLKCLLKASTASNLTTPLNCRIFNPHTRQREKLNFQTIWSLSYSNSNYLHNKFNRGKINTNSASQKQFTAQKFLKMRNCIVFFFKKKVLHVVFILEDQPHRRFT